MRKLLLFVASIAIAWAGLAQARTVKIMVDVTRNPSFTLGSKSSVRPLRKRITDLTAIVAGDDCWDAFVSGETFTGRKAITSKETWPFRGRLKKTHSNDPTWKPWPMGNGLQNLAQVGAACNHDGRTLKKFTGDTVVP